MKDDLPSYEGTRYTRGYKHGEPFPYNKVRRFLISNIGNKVDDTLSKWVHLAWLPVQYRTKEHFNKRLEQTWLIDGKLYYMGYSGYALVSERSYEMFYSNAGVLAYYKPGKVKSYKQREKEKQAQYFRYIKDGEQLIKKEGIWFLATFTVPTHRTSTAWINNKLVTVKTPYKQAEIERTYKSPVNSSQSGWRDSVIYCRNVRYKQLNSKELRSFGLENEKV